MKILTWFPIDLARPESMRVYLLRGGGVFDVLQVEDCLLPGVAAKVHQPTDAGVQVFGHLSPGDVLYADLDLLLNSPELGGLAFEMGCKVIVDVHMPIDQPEQIFAVTSDGARDPELDARAQEIWSDPERRHEAFRLLELADAITVGPAGRAPGYPVTELPDVHSPDDAALFYRRFAALVVRLTTKNSKLLRRWNAMVTYFPIKIFSKEVAAGAALPG